MWLWILIGLSIIMKGHGYSSGLFPESCESMSPEHKQGEDLITPQNSDPPFEVLYQRGKEGEPMTVSLQSNASTYFRGFMLEARETGMVGTVGKFIILDTATTQLLTCNGLSDSAVSQKNNQKKNLIRVNWTAEGEELNITFRATFLETFYIFWEKVDVNVTTPLPTTPPPTSTQPSTTATTEPSTTEPSTATSAASTTAENVTKYNSSNIIFLSEATVVMTCDVALVGTKAVLPIVITIFTNRPTHHLNKISKISCCLLCAAAEIVAVTLFCLGDSFKVTLVALTCVVMVINVIKLVIVSLPIGPSHELKETCDLVVEACSVIHEILAIAVVFLVVVETDDGKKDWPLKVMIAYTVWILLIVVWIFVFTFHRKEILGKSQIGSSKTRESWRQQRKKKKLSAAERTVITIAAILVVGTISFTVAVDFGLFF